MPKITRHAGVTAAKPVERRAGDPPAVPDVIERVVDLITGGQRGRADNELRHAVHLGTSVADLAECMIGLTPPDGWGF